MDNEDTIKHALAIVDAGLFRHAPEHRTPASTICWMKVAEFDDLHLALGLSKNGRWVREGNADVCELIPGEYVLPLLPCLELPRGDFLQRLENSLDKLELPDEIIATFPFEDLLTTALGSNSEHWTRLGIAWIQPSDITPRLEVALRKVAEATDKRIPQRIKHGAWKVLHTRK